MIWFWVIIGVCLFISFYFMTGKGAGFIAGYNTMTAHKKAKIDGKKLARMVGIYLFVITTGVIPIGYGAGDTYFIAFFIASIVLTVVLIVIANSKYVKKDRTDDMSSEVNEHEDTNKRKMITIITIIIVVVVSAISLIVVLWGARPTEYIVSTQEGTLAINSMYGETIDLDEVTDIYILDTLPNNISRTNGYSGFSDTLKGYCSSDIGDIKVFLYVDEPPFIYMKTDDEMYVFNEKAADDTRQLYDNLEAIINSFETGK